jgi:hypothetical protein
VTCPKLRENYDTLDDLVAELEKVALCLKDEQVQNKEAEEQKRAAEAELAAKEKQQQLLVDISNREADMLTTYMMELADHMKKGPTA